jgi:hypothetical protein
MRAKQISVCYTWNTREYPYYIGVFLIMPKTGRAPERLDQIRCLWFWHFGFDIGGDGMRNCVVEKV